MAYKWTGRNFSSAVALSTKFQLDPLADVTVEDLSAARAPRLTRGAYPRDV